MVKELQPEKVEAEDEKEAITEADVEEESKVETVEETEGVAGGKENEDEGNT
jgi:hypothetical protein